MMFVTATERELSGEMPIAWKTFFSYKPGNIIAFLNNFSNSVLYRDCYDELSAYVAAELNLMAALLVYFNLVDCYTFIEID
jgi:hypothetical protein